MGHKKTWRRLLSLFLALVMALGTAIPAAAENRGTAVTVEAVDSSVVTGERHTGGPTLSQEDVPVGDPISPDQVVRVSIVLEKPSTLDAGFSTVDIASNAEAMDYRGRLLQDQAAVRSAVESALGKPLEVVWNLTLAANIISADVAYGDIAAIEQVDGVASVYLEREYTPAAGSAGADTLQPNMAVSGRMNGTDRAWELGFRGEGTVIAIIDTGIDDSHQSFDPDAFMYALAEDGAAPKLTREIVETNVSRQFLHVGDTAASALYVNEKIPFGYNYADKNTRITHKEDTQTEHGSHVAGIAAANRYIRKTDGDQTTYEDALAEVKMAGNAPDAQLLALKVFGTNGIAKDGDVVAAIEDAITLGADVINLSLGMSIPGFASPSTNNDPYALIQDTLVKSDTVVVFSSGNEGSWAKHTANGYLYSDGAGFQMDGESGSYTNSFTVASVDNQGMISPSITAGGKEYTYTETYYRNAPFATLDTGGEEGTALEFIMVPLEWDGDGGNEAEVLQALGKSETQDKVIIVWRGETDFSTKANLGVQYGAKAVVVVNHEDTGAVAMDLTDFTGTIPVVSVTKAVGEAIYASGTEESTGDGWDAEEYCAGTLTVKGVHHIASESDTVTVSDFSSWGIPGSLELKPEISAPGGNIWSVFGETPSHSGTADYELMSGTSMAAPQISGMAALVQQYLTKQADGGKLTVPDKSVMTRRALTQGLMMSTAVPMKDAAGNYYPLMQQGAGLANVANAVSTPVYVTVAGQEDGKVKAELGDDFDREGRYEVVFTLHNMSSEPQEYTLSADAFTQAIKDGIYLDYTTRALDCAAEFTGTGIGSGADREKYDFNRDGEVDRADAQILLDAVISGENIPDGGDVNGDGAVDTYDAHALLNLGKTVAVPSNGSVTVTGVITLSDAEKARLNAENPGGAYVEAYITASAVSSWEGVIAPSLNIPVLAYYGSWTDASMFDVGDGEEWYNTLVAGGDSYVDGGEWEGERMPYTAKDFYDFYHAGEATNLLVEDDSHIIFNNGTVGPATGELSYYYTLIRNAGNGILRITYEEYGSSKVLWQSKDLGPEYGVAYFESYGMWLRPDIKNNLYYTLFNTADFDWQAVLDRIEAEHIDEVTFELIMAPEYYAGEDGAYHWDELTDGDSDNGELGGGAYLRTTVSVDNTPPEMVEVLQSKNAQNETVLVVTAKDDVSVTDITLWGGDGETLYYEYNETVYNSDEFDDMTGTGTPNFTPSGPDQETTVRFDGRYSYDFAIAFWYDLIVFNERVSPLEDDVYVVEIRDSAGNISTNRVFVGLEEDDSPEAVTDVAISETELEMTLGSSYQLTAAANPINLKDRTVTWKSSNEEVARIDENGLVTALSPGYTIITATSNQNAGKSASCRLTVYTVPLTLRGILGDADGNAKFFTWDMAQNRLTYDREVDANVPIAVTGDGEGGSYVLDAAYSMVHLDQDGKVLNTVYNWTNADENVVPYDMAYSKEAGGLFLCFGYYIIGPVSPDEQLPEELDAFDLSGDTRAWFYGIDIVEQEWSAGGQSGTWYIAAVDDMGYAWELCPYRSEYSEGLSAVYEDYPCIGLPQISYGEIPYSSLVAADGENWYYSVLSGETSVLYRLTFTAINDQDYDGYEWGLAATRLGSTPEKICPALLLEVDTGTSTVKYDFNNDGVANRADAQMLLDHVVKGTDISCATEDMDADRDSNVDTHDVSTLLHNLESTWTGLAAARLSGTRETVKSGTIGAESLAALEKTGGTAGAALAGGLEQVTAGGAGDGLTLNEITRTVTVPVYAGKSTNGQFTVKYDENLTFAGLEPGAMLTSCVVDEEQRTVTVGFAALSTEEKTPVVTLTFSYERGSGERQAELTMSVTEDGETYQAENPSTTVRTVTLPGEAEKVTFTGVMKDAADGKTYLYTWNLENGQFTKGKEVKNTASPVAVGDKGDGEFYLYDKDNEMHLVSKETGETEGDPWSLKVEDGWFGEEAVIPWAMTASKAGLHWGSDQYVYLSDTATGSTVDGIDSYDVRDDGFYPYAMAAIDGQWTKNDKSGDLTVYVFTDGSMIVKFLRYQENGSYHYLTEIVETDLPASNTLGEQFIDGEGSNYYGAFYPYTTMAASEDGTLYLAAMRGDPDYDEEVYTELYKLSYDAEQNKYISDLLGTQDTYPFLLLNVTDNSAAAARALTGSLDSITADGGEEGTDTGIVVDSENRTVTVPVYVSNSTNGEFTLTYDANMLTLDSATGAGAVLTSCDTGTAGQFHAGYAEKQAVSQKVFTLVFRCTAGGDTTLTLTVEQDGLNKTVSEKTYDLTLPGEPSTPPAPPTPPTGSPAAPESLRVSTGSTAGESGTVTVTTAIPDASVQDGTATSTVTEAMGDEIVKQAAEHDSSRVVIAPEMPADVTKTEVTIPGETVDALQEQTGASLTVETPVAEVTLPHEALEQLGVGRTVTVTAEKTGDAIAITVAVNGKPVDSVTGGVRAVLPLKDGQVAVLVNGDGSEIIVPKSLIEDGRTYVLLDGSATVKLVYNSKRFADVPENAWFASAVEFASSHELFNGTGEEIFAPGLPMNRAMLAAVLWRLEGGETAGAADFSDVPGESWYAESVAWASERGIVEGYGDSTFGPENNITREELAVMMYRYAKAVGMNTGRTARLDGFEDSGRVSGWAREAMEWAVAGGIITGMDGGRLNPDGPATRAETAAMLQRLIRLMVK